MILSPKEEAAYMLSIFKDWTHCYNTIVSHLNTIHSRQQTLLTLATLTLTITGFSGPKMAASNYVSRYSMIVGISMVLITIIMILVTSLKLNWFTQIKAENQKETLEILIILRNKRNNIFKIELVFLSIGLFLYVVAVIGYLFLAKG